MKATQLYLFNEMKPHTDTSGKIYVHGYRRRNGTYVKPYWRKHPGSQFGTQKHATLFKEQLLLFNHQ